MNVCAHAERCLPQFRCLYVEMSKAELYFLAGGMKRENKRKAQRRFRRTVMNLKYIDWSSCTFFPQFKNRTETSVASL